MQKNFLYTYKMSSMKISSKIVFFGLLFSSIIHFMHTSEITIDLNNVYFFTPSMNNCKNDPTNYKNQTVSDRWSTFEITFKDCVEIKKNEINVKSSSGGGSCAKIIHCLEEINYTTLFQGKKYENKNVIAYVLINPTVDDVLWLLQHCTDKTLTEQIITDLQNIITHFGMQYKALPFDGQCAVAECLINNMSMKAWSNDSKTHIYHALVSAIKINEKKQKEAEQKNINEYKNREEQSSIEKCDIKTSFLTTLFAIQLSLFLLIMCKQSNWYLLCTLSTVAGLGYGGIELYKVHQESSLT